jgi:hypothetical protein
MNGNGFMLNRASAAAPAVALGVLLCAALLPGFGRGGATPDERMQAAIAAAMASAPYRIGRWASRDIDIPEHAGRLLRPNAMLARRFVDLESGAVVDLLIVHCGDTRDMLGHYPPVCYPSHGWTPGGAHAAAIDLDHSNIPAMVYEFTQIRAAGRTARLRVINFFVLPGSVDGERGGETMVTGDMDEVYRRTNWLGASIRGVAQVQVLSRGDATAEQTIGHAREVLSGLSPLLESLGVHHYGRNHS